MQQVIRQIILLAAVTVCVVRCSGIRIRGGTSSYTYDPNNPTTLTWTCADDNGNIDDARWSRNGEFIEGTGRYTLNEGIIGTEDPQSFEGNYSCHSDSAISEPVSLYVVPRRNTDILTKETPLYGINVTFDCPLHFGSLREEWNVVWTVEDKNHIGITIDGKELYTRDNPEYQLVIRNASINYDGARFKCQAHRDGGYAEDSHFVTIHVFHNVEATTRPNKLVLINDISGEVIYEFKAYPRPNIKICYNDTCGSHGTYGRMQVSTVHSQDDTTHTARLTIHEMREEDSGNVTIEVRQPEKDNEFTDEIVLFLLYQIEVRMEDKATGREVPLHIVLRRPVYFDFEIEFVDKDDVSLGTINGEKGVLVFSCTITVNSDTEVRGRFKIGDKVGPYSEPVAVDVETPENDNSEQNGQQHTVIIVSVISVTVLLLVFIICTTIIIVIVVMCRLKKNKRNTGGRDTEDGTGEGDTQPEGESEVQLQNNGPQTISLNHGYQPQIAVIAATPHDMNGGLVHDVYPYGPNFPRPNLGSPRPHFGSASSNHSSAPSRKSSAGYESGTGSGIFPYAYSPCAIHYPRGACNYEVDAYHCCHQQHNLPQQQQPDHNRQMVNSQELSTTNLDTTARPPMRRNLSDPNISRHKQPASRPLEEQRSNKLLSSSSVV